MAQCPMCYSLERHRYAVVSLKDSLTGGQKTIHVAPEPAIERWLREISSDYISIDLMGPAMRRMDLTAIEFDDSSHSLIYCSHVLEHIPDDQQAMREMYRVLKPSGVLLVQVPIRNGETYEDESIVSPRDRQKHFLQSDHVRIYGMDLVDRLEAVGFDVEVLCADDLPVDIVRRQRLSWPMEKHLFVCHKPAG